MCDFPNVTSVNLKECRDYYGEKMSKKGPSKKKIRQWLKRDVEYHPGQPALSAAKTKSDATKLMEEMQESDG